MHDAKSKAGRFATAKELKRLAKAEKRLESKAKRGKASAIAPAK